MTTEAETLAVLAALLARASRAGCQQWRRTLGRFDSTTPEISPWESGLKPAPAPWLPGPDEGPGTPAPNPDRSNWAEAEADGASGLSGGGRWLATPPALPVEATSGRAEAVSAGAGASGSTLGGGGGAAVGKSAGWLCGVGAVTTCTGCGFGESRTKAETPPNAAAMAMKA